MGSGDFDSAISDSKKGREIPVDQIRSMSSRGNELRAYQLYRRANDIETDLGCSTPEFRARFFEFGMADQSSPLPMQSHRRRRGLPSDGKLGDARVKDDRIDPGCYRRPDRWSA